MTQSFYLLLLSTLTLLTLLPIAIQGQDALKAARTASQAVKAAAAQNAAATPVAVDEPVLMTIPVQPRFAMRHSFKQPYSSAIPFWNHGAGAAMTESYVRITPARQSRTGFLWNTVPVEMSDWEVEFEFAVSGMRALGGDGFAWWFVEKPQMLGTVYGSTDYWTGLGIFFDTFNNDNIGSNPLITAVYNDGTQHFDHTSDGATQALASCSYDFRNQMKPVAVKITYQNNNLNVQLAIHRQLSDNSPIYQPCINVDQIDLGVDKYFGLTAHTGDVADNHDINWLVTKDLSPTTVDLQAVRQQYHQKLLDQHHQPNHQELDASEFQHQVLTTLAQVHEEVNLLELGQLALTEYLQSGQLFEVAGFKREIPGAVHSDPIAPLSAPVALEQGTYDRIVNLGETTTNTLIEVRSLSSTVNTLSVSLSNNQNSQSTMATQIATLASTQSQSSSVQSANTATLKSLSDSLSTLHKKMDDLTSTMIALQRAQVQQSTTLTNHLTTITGHTSSVMEVLGNNGISWTMYAIFIFAVICLAALTFHTFQQHRQSQRYKLI